MRGVVVVGLDVELVGLLARKYQQALEASIARNFRDNGSVVCLPGSLARRIDPSGNTSFLSRSKSWFSGLSLP